MLKKYTEKTIASNMIISAVCKPASMLISYIYVPIVLNYLGVEKYGIWSTLLTILAWIGYFDIGIGNGLRNKLTESISKRDGNGQKLVSSAYAFIAVIMIIVAIVFSFVASFVNWNRVFGVNYNIDELSGVVITCIFFVAINFILSICKNVFYALQKAANVSVMELGIQVLNLLGVLIATQITNGNLFIMAIIYGSSMIIVNIIASAFIYRKNREFRPRFKEVDITTGKSITNLGIQFFIVQICALVLFTTDSLIISYIYGAADVTPYNTVNKLFNIVIGIYTAMIAPIWSAVTKAKAEHKYDVLLSTIKKLLLVVIPFGILTIILSLLFRKISLIWLGRSLDYTTLLIIFGGLYCFLSLWCNTFASIVNGLELMKQSIYIALIQAAINIPLSLYFAQGLGLKSAGVLAGTVISMMISAVAHPIIVYKYINTAMQNRKM